jgi:hypothetical protein
MPKRHRVDERVARQGLIRPLVLLSIPDDELRARFAYGLTARGFDVTMTKVRTVRHQFASCRPDVIVAALNIQDGVGGLSDIHGRDPGARSVPVVAVAPDVSEATRDIARREGCVAVCLTTCSGAALAMGLRAVLG